MSKAATSYTAFILWKDVGRVSLAIWKSSTPDCVLSTLTTWTPIIWQTRFNIFVPGTTLFNRALYWTFKHSFSSWALACAMRSWANSRIRIAVLGVSGKTTRQRHLELRFSLMSFLCPSPPHSSCYFRFFLFYFPFIALPARAPLFIDVNRQLSMSWNRGIRSCESENVAIKLSEQWSTQFLNEDRKSREGGMRKRMMPQPRQLRTARRMVKPDLRWLGCLDTK